VELARRLGMSQSKVSKIETGALMPSVTDVEAWADACSAAADVRGALLDRVDALQTETRSWRSVHRPSFRRRQDEIRKIEDRARAIRLFQPSVVPGLLQTAEYARHILQLADMSGSGDVRDAVAARIARQASLYDQAKQFTFVITEGALRWQLCPPDVLLAQLHHISSLSTLSNVRIGIIPWSAPVAARQTTMFCLFDEELVYIETMTAELTMRDRRDIEFYLAAFSRLAEAATFDDAARALLARIAADVRQLGS
jgi:transcriptional regulator with XRE-family HTH domain